MYDIDGNGVLDLLEMTTVTETLFEMLGRDEDFAGRDRKLSARQTAEASAQSNLSPPQLRQLHFFPDGLRPHGHQPGREDQPGSVRGGLPLGPDSFFPSDDVVFHRLGLDELWQREFIAPSLLLHYRIARPATPLSPTLQSPPKSLSPPPPPPHLHLPPSPSLQYSHTLLIARLLTS